MSGKLAVIMTAVAVLGGSAAAAAEKSAPQERVAQEHAAVVSADPVDWTPHVLDGRVTALAVVGDRVIVGGEFTKVRSADGTTVKRHNIFAYDAGSGTIAARFAPKINGRVTSLAPAGQDTVVVGGTFTKVEGENARGVVRLSVPDGKRTGIFDGAVTKGGGVNDLAVRGHWLYIGGNFTGVAGRSRAALARLNLETGKMDPNFTMQVSDPRAGRLKVEHLELTPNGDRLAIDGTFTEVAGERRYQLALIDTTAPTPELASWATNAYTPECLNDFHTYMRDIDFSPDGSYFVVVTTGGPATGTLCDSAARFETYDEGTEIEPTWVDSTGGDSLYSVAVTGEAVYVGGHQRWMNNHHGKDSAGPGAVSRTGIAALDPVNGMPLAWNPTRTRGVGVLAFLVTERGLLVGSDTDQLGHEFHGRLGMFPVGGGRRLTEVSSASLPSDLYLAGEQLHRYSFDGSRVGSSDTVDSAVPWKDTRAAFMVGGTIYYAGSGGELYAAQPDGSTVTEPASVEGWFDWSEVTAMFWRHGRLYYTLDGESKLYYRYFSPHNPLAGSQEFVAAEDERWASVQGMTYAEETLFHADEDGNLHRMKMDGGVPQPDSDKILSGPDVDGRDWNKNALFLHNP